MLVHFDSHRRCDANVAPLFNVPENLSADSIDRLISIQCWLVHRRRRLHISADCLLSFNSLIATLANVYKVVLACAFSLNLNLCRFSYVLFYFFFPLENQHSYTIYYNSPA